MNLEIPKLEPKITKDFLLSKNSEETYMQTYLGTIVRKGLIVSPLRQDRKPTASFYRNKSGELIFHDFGIGFHGNFVSVVMYQHNCTYFEALRIIAEDFGYVERSDQREPIKIKHTETVIQEKQATIIQIEKQDFTESELKWWKSFGINEETLKKFRIYSCKNVFLNGNLFISSSKYNMIFGYYFGKKNGIELWRIYMPQRKSYRFLSNTSSETIQNANNIPNTGDLLVITKSMKDCLLLYELGVPAIAPCSEVMFMSDQRLNRLKSRFKKIIVCYDNDSTGISFMRKIKKNHPELEYFFIPRKFEAKDPSDFYKKYGRDTTIDYIEQLKKYYVQKEEEK